MASASTTRPSRRRFSHTCGQPWSVSVSQSSSLASQRNASCNASTPGLAGASPIVRAPGHLVSTNRSTVPYSYLGTMVKYLGTVRTVRVLAAHVAPAVSHMVAKNRASHRSNLLPLHATRVLAVAAALPIVASEWECPAGSISGSHGRRRLLPRRMRPRDGRGCGDRAGGCESCCALDIQMAGRSCNDTARVYRWDEREARPSGSSVLSADARRTQYGEEGAGADEGMVGTGNFAASSVRCWAGGRPFPQLRFDGPNRSSPDLGAAAAPPNLTESCMPLSEVGLRWWMQNWTAPASGLRSLSLNLCTF